MTKRDRAQRSRGECEGENCNFIIIIVPES